MNIKIDDAFCEKLLLQASESPRKRSHFNLHSDLNEPVQRLCIALKRGSYVRPHHHPKSNKWEMMLAIRGAVSLMIFDQEGKVLEKLVLSPGESVNGIEMKPNTWHTVMPLTDDTVILEVKEGPFTATKDSDFASWAPLEGDDTVVEFLSWAEGANPGDIFTAD